MVGDKKFSPGQSDLLFEGFLCGPGGSVSSSHLDRLVGHDACGEFLLGLLKAGTSGSVHPMHLVRKKNEYKVGKTEVCYR